MIQSLITEKLLSPTATRYNSVYHPECFANTNYHNMIIPSIVRIAAASCASTLTACMLWSGGLGVAVEHSNAIEPPSNPPILGLILEQGDNAVGRLQPCPYESNCVSSNYLEPPNRYISPLTTFRDRDTAFARAIRDLKDAEASSTTKVVEILPRQYYIHATVPGTAQGSLDDVEILFAGDNDDTAGIVHLRCQARVTLPPPPFCLKKNCINGNMDQRTRMDTIARTLGLPAADQERMQSAKWTPIFFNSDRVPGFDEEY